MTTKKNHDESSAATSMQITFERVPVCGREIEAARDGERVWVSVRKVCEALAISREVQQRKLRTAPWAVRTTMILTGPDGKNYENFCIDLDCLPMWLATIDAARVGTATAKRLIVDYQIKAAAVLRDHFYGRRGAVNDADLDTRIRAYLAPLVDAVKSNAEATAAQGKAFESVTMILAAQSRRLDALEADRNIKPANDAAGIGAAGAAKVLGTLRSIAATKAGAIGQGGNAKVKNRIRFIEERSLRRELRYPMDRGCSWGKITEEQFGRAMLILERMTAEADDIARLAAKDAGPLFRAVPVNDASKKAAN